MVAGLVLLAVIIIHGKAKPEITTVRVTPEPSPTLVDYANHA